MSWGVIQSLAADVRGMFFPPICAACGDSLAENTEFICVKCRWEIPLTFFWKRADNPVARKFDPYFPVANACSFHFFTDRSGFRDLIHDFKYRGMWRSAYRMGEWFGRELAVSPLYEDIDIIVPVPLHYRKRTKRGYNQSEVIACGMSRAMGVPVVVDAVRRSRNNDSQTMKSVTERWENVRGIFSVRRAERLRGKHILLVDDVLTSGSTLISCAETILASAPGVRISIATLAVSRHSLDDI